MSEGNGDKRMNERSEERRDPGRRETSGGLRGGWELVGVGRRERGERGHQPARPWEPRREWLFAGHGTGGRCTLATGRGGGARAGAMAPGCGVRPAGSQLLLVIQQGEWGSAPPGPTAQEVRTRLLTWLEERDELNWEAQPGRLGSAVPVCVLGSEGAVGGTLRGLVRTGRSGATVLSTSV